jgi:hypothetical protein
MCKSVLPGNTNIDLPCIWRLLITFRAFSTGARPSLMAFSTNGKNWL